MNVCALCALSIILKISKEIPVLLMSLVVIYNQFCFTCSRLADPPTMGGGDHALTVTPHWTRSNPLKKTSLIYHVSLIECAGALRTTSPAFEAQFVEYRRDAGTVTFRSVLGFFRGALNAGENSEHYPDGIRYLSASTRNVRSMALAHSFSS